MGKVIFNSGDFGYNHSVNYGIMDVYRRGILTSTILMANMPGSGHTVKPRKEMPRLGIGVHLTLTCSKPLPKTIDTLIESGEFRSLSYYQHPFNIDKDRLYQERNAQIQKIYHAGIIPTYLDNHHHTHTLGENQEVVVTLAKKYDLPVRSNSERKDKARHVDYFESCFNVVGKIDEKKRQVSMSMEKYLVSLLMILREDRTIEVVCYVVYLDQKLLNGPSFVHPRIHQVEFLIHSAFAQKVKNDPLVELVTYEDI